jgi:predicted metal-dependent hydrolase
MDKVERILQRYKTYIGVKDVKMVVRPYKTRDAFTNLSSSPPTIYLNEHLIDDEEVVEYLIIRELIHIKLHQHPPPRYMRPTLTYTEKFESKLYFFIPKEKVEEIREKIWKKLFEKLRQPARR